MKEEIVIIGGGLAGLTTAYLLKNEDLNPLIFEAGSRLGGRIYTKKEENNSFELGATWVFRDEKLKRLIHELGLELYPQYLRGDALIKYDPSMSTQRSPTESLMNGAVYHKVKDGTGAIIQALADQIGNDKIMLNKSVEKISYVDDGVQLAFEHGHIVTASKVIIAAPPKVISERIAIEPKLENERILSSTHTWMGESAKFAIQLDRDFWRKNNLSGFVYSNYGLIREVQDHSTNNNVKPFGLLGFIQPSGELLTDFDKRKQAIFKELGELFDISEDNILGYDDFLWSEHFMGDNRVNYNANLMPHQNNGHSFFQQPHWNHRLFFAGAETSASNPGYMEGAIDSAYRATRLVLEN